MPKYTLVITTYQRQHKGDAVLCGTIKIKDGKVLREVLFQPTLKHLARELRKCNLLPTDLRIEKKGSVELQIECKKSLE